MVFLAACSARDELPDQVLAYPPADANAPAQAVATAPPGLSESANPETITWRTRSFEPFYILTGPDAGTGLYDSLIDLYVAALPQFEHEFVDMTGPRAVELMRSGDTRDAVCHVSMFERATEGLAVSRVNSVLLAHIIVMDRSVAETHGLDELTPVSLIELVSDASLVGGIASFNTHPELVPFESRRAEMSHLVHKREDYHVLLEMLIEGRIDYVIQYSPVANRILGRAGRVDDYVFLQIEESADEPLVEVVGACSPNATGRAAVASMNQVLDEAADSGQLLDIQLRWYDNDTEQAIIAERFSVLRDQ